MSRSLVHEATSDDQNPPSGYVLKELAQKTLTSPADSTDILNYLLKRLDKDSPDVRLKALLAIKYVCQNGRDDFRLALQRNNEAIRACTFYKGPLDPLRGDAPYQKVRDAAKDTIAAVYDNTQRATQAAVSSRIKGMGGMGAAASPTNDSFSSSDRDRDRDRERDRDRDRGSDRGDYQGTYSVPKLESGAYSTGRMQGFGNPAFDQPKPSKPATNYREFVRPSGYNPETSSYNPDNIPAPATADVSKPRTRGAVGGVWASDSPSPAAVEQKSSASYSTGSTFRYDSGPAAPASRPTRTTSASSGEYEGRLVDTITTPSGVRATPTKEELKAFTDKARSLDPILLAQLLQKKFTAPAYQTTLKALCVVEALVQGDFPGVVEFFRNENDGLIELETHTHKQVGSKASQILVAIGLKEAPQRAEEPASVYVPSSAPARGAAVPDLISFDEPAASPSPPVAAPLAAASAPASSFDFLSGSSGSPAAAPAPVAAQANGGVVKLFSDLTIKSQSPAAQRPPVAAAAAADPLVSIFGDALPAAKPQNNRVDDLIKSKQSAYPAAAANPYGLPVAAANPYGMAPAPVDPFFGAGFPVSSTGAAFNGAPAAQAVAYGMPVVPTAVPMGYYNYPAGAVGAFPGAARPNAMAAPLPDFQVREAGPKQPRRDFIGDLSAPAPAETQSGFAFTQKADAFDFVQDHLKQST